MGIEETSRFFRVLGVEAATGARQVVEEVKCRASLSTSDKAVSVLHTIWRIHRRRGRFRSGNGYSPDGAG